MSRSIFQGFNNYPYQKFLGFLNLILFIDQLQKLEF